MDVTISGTVLSLQRGDITLADTEAIGNAANSGLAGGGGVDGAIHRAGGPSIMAECRKIGGCATGKAVLTGGGNLKAGYVIHGVGPVYHGGLRNEAELLKSVYAESLAIASSKDIKSISFPSISTGVYGYPIKEAASIALSTVIDFLKKDHVLELVRFVLFSDGDLKVYEDALAKLLGDMGK